jgi:hypothetical protein
VPSVAIEVEATAGMEPGERDGVVRGVGVSGRFVSLTRRLVPLVGGVRRWFLRAGPHDVFFALNLACALVYVLLICLIKRVWPTRPPDDLFYFFLRGAARIERLLLLNPEPPVSTLGVARHMPGIVEQLGSEMVLLVSVVTVAMIAYLLLKVLSGTRLHRVITTAVLGPSLLFAVPLSYLFVMQNTAWVHPFYGAPFFWGVRYPLLVGVLCAEGLVAIGVSLASRIRPVADGLLETFSFLHLGFWLPVLWSTLPTWDVWGDLISYVGFLVPRALLIGWVLMAATWALRLRRHGPEAQESGALHLRWTLLAGITAVAMSAFVWLPHPTRSVADPSARDAAVVELSHGPCYGSCPTYVVRVHGNGSVEYTGDLDGRRGTATATLSTAQVSTILEKLESVSFFGIEDSAFTWSFDRPAVSVLVSVDGVTHRVSSDEASTGSASGTQARFLQVANDIDQIIGTRRWRNARGK